LDASGVASGVGNAPRIKVAAGVLGHAVKKRSVGIVGMFGVVGGERPVARVLYLLPSTRDVDLI